MEISKLTILEKGKIQQMKSVNSSNLYMKHRPEQSKIICWKNTLRSVSFIYLSKNDLKSTNLVQKINKKNKGENLNKDLSGVKI